MKHLLTISTIIAALFLTGCCNKNENTPRAKHVIFLGFDAMSSIGIQRATTPTFNYLIENGAVSLDTRCVRETSSSQNWMSMVTGAPIEMHGVTGNDWERDNYSIEPAARNSIGLFPTMFDVIREQKPDAKMYAYIEWSGETRMYDMTVFDKALYSNKEKGYSADELLQQAFADYLADEPELLFVSIDITDHQGHETGHESQEYFDCISHMDKQVGEFVKKLEERDMLKDAVIIITADHGGIHYGHGGDSMEELQIPVIMYGKGVTKGKFMAHANMIYDNAATVAGLLGVELPRECRGRFMQEAFEPKTDLCYVPVPLIHPFKGVVDKGEKVTITVDTEGAEIYYTLDGTAPTKESIRYTGPFELKESCTIQAIAYKNGNYSLVASNFLYTAVPEGEASIEYKLYKNYNEKKLPDFTKFGKADAVGYLHAFTLNGLPVAETEDHYAVIFSSTLQICEAGRCKFELASYDGSRLIIDGKEIINNDGSHSRTTKYGVADLTSGSHIIKVEYFEDHGGQSLELRYAPEGKTPRPIFPSELKR